MEANESQRRLVLLVGCALVLGLIVSRNFPFLGQTQIRSPRPSLLPADYCQRGLPFTSSGSRTELVWKRDIRFRRKALRLKASDADRVHYCQLGKMAVVRTANPNICRRRLWGRSDAVFGFRMDQGSFQNLDGILAPVGSGSGTRRRRFKPS